MSLAINLDHRRRDTSAMSVKLDGRKRQIYILKVKIGDKVYVIWEKMNGWVFTEDGYAIMTADGYFIKCADQ